MGFQHKIFTYCTTELRQYIKCIACDHDMPSRSGSKHVFILIHRTAFHKMKKKKDYVRLIQEVP